MFADMDEYIIRFRIKKKNILIFKQCTRNFNGGRLNSKSLLT